MRKETYEMYEEYIKYVKDYLTVHNGIVPPDPQMELKILMLNEELKCFINTL